MDEQGVVIPMPAFGRARSSRLQRYFVEVTGLGRTRCVYTDAPSPEAAQAQVLDSVGFKVKVTAK